MIEGSLGRMMLGDRHPVRIMAVINLSQESFYKGSVAASNQALVAARRLVGEGADLIDLGAVSTAPGSPKIDESTEAERLFPALKSIADNLDISISADTQRVSIAEHALSIGADCINDVSGLIDPEMARTVADHNASAIIMASRQVPGDLLGMDDILNLLAERARSALEAGVDRNKIVVDPGVGRWVPHKEPQHDLAILDGYRRLRALGRPIMAALSRKSFIGARLNLPDPEQRLCGSLAATAIAVYNGAHIVRTHDVSESLETIRMAEAIRGLPPMSCKDDIWVEVLGYLGHESDLAAVLSRIGVDPGGYRALSRKGSFRLLALKGISSIESIIIKQEMLARGGDAAIPKMTLRNDPNPQEIIIMGTLAQTSGLVRKLKEQPFRLPSIGEAISAAERQIDDPRRYLGE